MSIFEWPDNLREAVIAEGLVSQWKYLLELPTAEQRNKAKQLLHEKLLTYPQMEPAVRMYLELGPILAEHEAISKAAKKYPMIRDVAPEILTIQEAIAVAMAETPLMSMPNCKLHLERFLRCKPQMRLLNGEKMREIFD